MMARFRPGLRWVPIPALMLAICAPAHAGFLEMLFGQRPVPPAAAPTYQTDLPALGVPLPPRHGPRVVHHEEEISGKAVATCCHDGQDPTIALLTDPTLRQGDAVMMPAGLRVFDGPSSSRHGRKDFVALTSFRYSTKRLSELALIDRVSSAPVSLVKDTVPSLTIRRKADVASSGPATAVPVREVRQIIP